VSPDRGRWGPLSSAGRLIAALLAAALLTLGTQSGCAARPAPEVGKASWYGRALAGRPTASGEPFRPWKRTAAHKTLPFGSVVRVTRTGTGATVRVVINDRGPFVAGRVIDLSRRAARRIDMLQVGVTPVEVKVVGCRRRYESCAR
jgi:rare lipoprotein A